MTVAVRKLDIILRTFAGKRQFADCAVGAYQSAAACEINVGERLLRTGVCNKRTAAFYIKRNIKRTAFARRICNRQLSAAFDGDGDIFCRNRVAVCVERDILAYLRIIRSAKLRTFQQFNSIA